MDGFKNSTKTHYMTGGSTKRAEAKMGKVMGEFAAGKLHSGSKKGPEVKNPKQAVAIAMSEARKAGAKMPMKKAMGGPVKMREGGTFNERGQRATMAEIAAEDLRMANAKREKAAAEMAARMAKRKPPAEGISTRPTDASGRRATDADLGMTAKKPVVKGGAMAGAAGAALAGAAARAAQAAEAALLRRTTGAAMTEGERRAILAAAKKAVPSYSDRPVIRRNTGGLAVMPKGKC